MTRINRVFALVLVIIFACTAGLIACAPANEAALASTTKAASAATANATASATPNSTTEATPTPVPTPLQSTVPPESLTYKQKSDMIWTRNNNLFGNSPARIFIFYIEFDGEGKLIWVEKESNPGGGGFDLFDVFNGELMFHVSIPIKDEAKVTPADFPQYIDEVNEMLRDYNIVAAGKLLDISDIYLNNNIDFSEIGDPYEVLISHLRTGFSVKSKDELLDAFIDVTPAKYLLPFWEYIPNAVTPDSYFNPPSPSPVITPMPDNYKEQMELTPSLTKTQIEQRMLLLGINQNFTELLVKDICVFYYKINNVGRVVFTCGYYKKEDGVMLHAYYNVFNGEYFFPFDTKGRTETYIDEMPLYFSKSSDMLTGVKITGASGLSHLDYVFPQWGIKYNGNELIDKISEDSLNSNPAAFIADSQIRLSKQDIINLYLDLVPQEYIPPFWEYVPNAVTPDGFFTPTPIISPTAVP